MAEHNLPIPPHYNSAKVGEVWNVSYEECAREAEQWARGKNIVPSSQDEFRLSLVLVDLQNTFCIPGFELYVGGASGTAAIEDNCRLCEFIYRNLDGITEICPTMDTHLAMQIFHSIFLVNEKGEHPEPFTLITEEDIVGGKWQLNPRLAPSLGITESYGREYLRHYVHQLKVGGKLEYTIWPYHAMLGGIGHALVSAVEEAVFFHSIARCTPPDFQVKGDNPLTEHYSVLSPEVTQDSRGKTIAERNVRFTEKIMAMDAVVITGQAKSHCLAWTIDDLLKEIEGKDKSLVEKVYLLEDCTSPIVIPEVADYTEEAERAFERFADAGMHIVRSTDPIHTWRGMSK